MTSGNDKRRVTKKALFECIAKGDATGLRQLLEAGGDPNTIDRSDGYTLLNFAFEREDDDIVEILLAAGANPRPGVIDNMSEAIRAGNAYLVKLLLGAGLSANELNCEGNDETGRTPIMEAARRGHVEVVKVLVAAGADVNAHDLAGNSAVIHAAKAKRAIVVEFLRPLLNPTELTRLEGLSQQEKEEQRYGELYQAIRRGRLDEVKRLIEGGLSANGPEQKLTPMVPLAEAASEERQDIMEFLLEHGADVNGPSHISPLAWAAQRGNAQMVRRLLSLGADVNAGQGTSNTPLMAAAVCRSDEITKLLIAAGADVNVEGAYGKTALSEALWEERMRGPNPVVSILKAAGATQ